MINTHGDKKPPVETIVFEAYDRVLAYHFVGEDNSWVVLQSQQNNLIHVIDMDECPKGMGKQSSETVEKGFRNNLFAAEGSIQIDITDNEEGDFWEQTSATFAADGSHVII